MKRIIAEITKNETEEGIVNVRVWPKAYSQKRKVYSRKTGKFKGVQLINMDCEVYSFTWDESGLVGENFKWLGNYKSFQQEIDAEEAEAKETFQIPEVAPAPVVIEEDGELRHEKYNQIKVCVKDNIPVYLVGPAGSGKNHTLEQIAEDLGLDFYFTNSVQQEFKLTGFIDAGGNYHETEFYKAFVNGGLFFLDEMDASIPEVLVLLNAAIANRYFEFPTGKVTAHKKFRVVSAGNTVGSGADEKYSGRLVLDQATLDRFAIIHFDYSMKIELHLAKGNSDLVLFIRQLREKADKLGIRTTFSYRCITMVTKLEGKLELNDIMFMAVLKGVDKDTINTLKVSGETRYHQAMYNIAA
jgi:hypothetical protein